MPFLYAPVICLTRGQPFEPVERIADVACIGHDACRETFVDDELCQCDPEDDDD